jgi:uncharacterized membrane protein
MYKKIAPLYYLTFFGFIAGALLFSSRPEKRSVDLFHMRQSFGLYATSFGCYLVFKLAGLELFYANIPSIIVTIPLFILWFLGFKAAIEDKETPLPLVGRLYQKWFAFVGR